MYIMQHCALSQYTVHVQCLHCTKFPTVCSAYGCWVLALNALLHLICLHAPSTLRTDPNTMNVRRCALITSTLAKCECERAMILMMSFMELHVMSLISSLGKDDGALFAAI